MLATKGRKGAGRKTKWDNKIPDFVNGSRVRGAAKILSKKSSALLAIETYGSMYEYVREATNVEQLATLSSLHEMIEDYLETHKENAFISR